MSGTPSGGQSDPRIPAHNEVALDHLRQLLQQQLDLVHQGRLAAAVELFDQTDRWVREIVLARGPGGALEQVAAKASESWLGIERLYQELSVALTAQRTEVAAALNTVRRGKTVLQAYGSHLSSA